MSSKWRRRKKRLEDEDNYYYDGGPLWSRNAVISMVVGGRSMGKTYWAKAKFIDLYLEHGYQWVYLRRHANTLDEFRKDGGAKLLSDVADEFPQHEMRVKGDLIQIRLKVDEEEKVKNQWQTMGYLMSLASFMQYKGTAYDAVRYILFDEFIREARGKAIDRYLADEVGTFYSLYNTIDRMRDVVRVYMTANAGDLVNPYFMTWKIGKPPAGFSRYNNGLICLEYGGSAKFMDHARGSKFAQLIQGSSYEAFAIENKFINDTPEFIAGKPAGARCNAALSYLGKDYGVWRDIASGNMYVTGWAPKDAPCYALMRADMRPNVILLKRTEGLLRAWADMYRYGMMYFDSPMTKAAWSELMGLLGIN